MRTRDGSLLSTSSTVSVLRTLRSRISSTRRTRRRPLFSPTSGPASVRRRSRALRSSRFSRATLRLCVLSQSTARDDADGRYSQIRLLYISFAMTHYYSVHTPNQIMYAFFSEASSSCPFLTPFAQAHALLRAPQDRSRSHQRGASGQDQQDCPQQARRSDSRVLYHLQQGHPQDQLLHVRIDSTTSSANDS